MRRTEMRGALASAVLVCASAVPAHAQYADGISATAEAATDERRRGLSWSDGNPVLRGTIAVSVAQGLSLDAAAVSLWGSGRHSRADAVIDLGAAYVRQMGRGWRLSAEGRYHLFPGASDQGYGEIGTAAGFLIGPASVDIAANYAPPQSSIGGDNLYFSASTAVGVPGTPLTISTRVGHSSGTVRDAANAERLRPDGSYWDYGVGVEYLKGRWFAGLRYADSSVGRVGERHAGTRLIGHVGLTL